MDQQQVVDAITGKLEDAPGLVALFLGGSLGRGTADAESDVDFTALVDSADQSAFATFWRRKIEEVVPVVHWADRATPAGRLINAVSTKWLRIDVAIMIPAAIQISAQDQIRPLIDSSNLHATLRSTLPDRAPDPARVGGLITEFIRVLGLLPVVIARREYVVAVAGVGMLRQMLIDLMLEEVPIADRGGALHLGRLLDAGEIAMLEELFYPGPRRDAVIEAHLAIARIFLPRARELATRLDIIWPEAFEAATRWRLSDALGVAALE